MPQVHRVIAAQVVAKWLSGRVSQKVSDQPVGGVSPGPKPSGPEIVREAGAPDVAGTRDLTHQDGMMPTAELALWV